MSSLSDEIMALKKEKNAVLLVHNYQRPEIQGVADFLGDSLGLSIQASKTSADVIVFCGVDFMAESAKILSPGKIVIHPEPDAMCPMAAMIDAEGLRMMKKEYPDAVVVGYVNTSAEVKTELDYCCTSANAVRVVKSLKEKKIIFVPDTNLGLYVKRFTPDKEIVLWPGFCPTHQNITKDDLLALKVLHPDAEIIVHPECTPDVIDIADHVASTEGMVKRVVESAKREFIMGTEKDMCYRLKKENPGKDFFATGKALCPNMKKITIEKVVASLRTLQPRVELSKETIEKASLPLKRMMEAGRGN
jgi:quinolinate synthase